MPVNIYNEETSLSVCTKGDVIKVNKAFSGRVALPGYSGSPLNATMEISGLRTNDSGTYHCQVVEGSNYERDTVPLLVSGKLGGHFVGLGFKKENYNG